MNSLFAAVVNKLLLALLLILVLVCTKSTLVSASNLGAGSQEANYGSPSSGHTPPPPPTPPSLPPTLAPVTCKPRKGNSKPFKHNWVATAGGSQNEWVSSVATDSKSNSITVGWTASKTFQVNNETTAVPTNFTLNAGFMTKLSPAGKFIWTVIMNTTNDCGFFSIDIDDRKNSDDSIYAVASFIGNATIGNKTWVSRGGYDGLVLKFSADGRLIWSKQIGGRGDDATYDIFIGGKSGDLYVVGGFAGTVRFNARTTLHAYGQDGFVMRMKRTTGAVVWVQRLGARTFAHTNAVAVDDQEQYLYINGEFASTVELSNKQILVSVGSNDLFFAKMLCSTGFLVWARSAGGEGFDVTYEIAVDREGNSYSTGTMQGVKLQFGNNMAITKPTSATNASAVVVKLSADGEFSKPLITRGPYLEQAFGIVVDDEDDCCNTTSIYFNGYVLGNTSIGETFKYTSANDTFSDAILVKLNTELQVQWLVVVGGIPKVNERALAVTMDKDNRLISAGFYSNATLFGSINVTVNRGGRDVYISQLVSQN